MMLIREKINASLRVSAADMKSVLMDAAFQAAMAMYAALQATVQMEHAVAKSIKSVVMNAVRRIQYASMIMKRRNCPAVQVHRFAELRWHIAAPPIPPVSRKDS
jgi:hypothetical protein